jgi:uncharacterized protein with NRDE domain
VCTLILAIDVVAPESVMLGANRDESPDRPSEPPRQLSDSPPVAGGRDALAGGTWLAIHGRDTAIAMLNRRGEPITPTRSRGLLALDVARDPRPEVPFEALVRDRYAPFTLVIARPVRSWLLAWDGRRARMVEIPSGWHVLTHTELDDANEPRAAWLLKSLRSLGPQTRASAEREIVSRLARHDDPAVCLHDGPMRTVSSAVVWLASGEAVYSHAEGPPCVTPYVDYSSLLIDAETDRT